MAAGPAPGSSIDQRLDRALRPLLRELGMDEEDIDSLLSAVIGLCLIGLQKTANRRKKGRRR